MFSDNLHSNFIQLIQFFRCVRRSVGPSVMLSSKSMKNGLLRILNDLDSAGRSSLFFRRRRGGRRDEEVGRMGRKEAQEGRMDEESEKMKKLLKKMKNEKVAKGRIIGLAGPCFWAAAP